jgi:hypothetical protein
VIGIFGLALRGQFWALLCTSSAADDIEQFADAQSAIEQVEQVVHVEPDSLRQVRELCDCSHEAGLARRRRAIPDHVLFAEWAEFQVARHSHPTDRDFRRVYCGSARGSVTGVTKRADPIGEERVGRTVRDRSTVEGVVSTPVRWSNSLRHTGRGRIVPSSGACARQGRDHPFAKRRCGSVIASTGPCDKMAPRPIQTSGPPRQLTGGVSFHDRGRSGVLEKQRTQS